MNPVDNSVQRTLWSRFLGQELGLRLRPLVIAPLPQTLRTKNDCWEYVNDIAWGRVKVPGIAERRRKQIGVRLTEVHLGK